MVASCAVVGLALFIGWLVPYLGLSAIHPAILAKTCSFLVNAKKYALKKNLCECQETCLFEKSWLTQRFFLPLCCLERIFSEIRNKE
jgi:hypothetical protein